MKLECEKQDRFVFSHSSFIYDFNIFLELRNILIELSLFYVEYFSFSCSMPDIMLKLYTYLHHLSFSEVVLFLVDKGGLRKVKKDVDKECKIVLCY